MRWDFFDVKQRQPVRFKDLFRRDERKIREMLVIDRVVLSLLHQSQQVRKLQRRHSLRLQNGPDAAHEIVEVRHLRQDVIADHQVSLLCLAHHFLGGLAAEKPDQRWHALFNRHPCHVGGGFNSQRWDSLPDEVLQQIAVVAGQLDDQTLFVEVEPNDNHVHIVSGVLQPGV